MESQKAFESSIRKNIKYWYKGPKRRKEIKWATILFAAFSFVTPLLLALYDNAFSELHAGNAAIYYSAYVLISVFVVAVSWGAGFYFTLRRIIALTTLTLVLFYILILENHIVFVLEIIRSSQFHFIGTVAACLAFIAAFVDLIVNGPNEAESTDYWWRVRKDSEGREELEPPNDRKVATSVNL